MAYLLSDLVAQCMVLPVDGADRVYNFRHRDRCLKSLFWTLHHNLDQGKKIVVVMDKSDDLETLNYFLNQYDLQFLSLIVTDHSQLNVPYLLSKFRDDQMQKQQILQQKTEQNTVRLKLEDALDDFTLAYRKLHERALFPKSLVEINDRVSNTKRKIDTSENIFNPTFSYLDYQYKKTLFKEAEALYDPKFKYCTDTNPFNLETVKQVEQGSLVSILNDMKAEAEELMAKMKVFELEVTETINDKHSDNLSQLKTDIEKVNKMLIKSSPLTETEVEKQLYFQKQLFDKLNISIAPPVDASGLEEGFERISQAAEVKLNTTFERIQKEKMNLLSSLTAADTAYPQLKPLIREVNQLSNKLRDLDLFIKPLNKKSVTFAFQKQNLEAIIAQLEYGLYFIFEHTTYLDWLKFEEKLTHDDKAIINYLAKQDGFWENEFEALFLEYFISYNKSSVTSLVPKAQYLETLLAEFKKGYLSELLERNAGSTNYIKNIDAHDWSTFLSTQGPALMDSYPLMIVSSDFYRLHAERITAFTDKFFFYNEVPKTIKNEEWLNNTYFGCNAYFSDLVANHSQLPKTIPIYNSYFNVNRDFSYLNHSDRNRGASFLGQQLAKLDTKLRIYQTRELSIISFWTESKNANLLDEIAGLGVKEIVSNDGSFNLVPAILADTDKRTYVLIEDEAFCSSESMSFAEQLLLKEDLLTAGIKIKSVDNFSMISRDTRKMQSIVSELKAYSAADEQAHLV